MEKKYNMFVIPAVPLQNVQILKDRIVIPYVCYKHFGKSLTILTKKKEEYPYASFLKGAVIQELDCDTEQDHMTACVEYVFQNSWKVDVLFLFGAYIQYIPLVYLYKQLRPDGIIYLKLDANSSWVNAFPMDNPEYKRFIYSCDIVSCEAVKLQRLLCKKWRRRVEYIPNGIYFPLYERQQSTVEYSKKENVILTVGRLGSAQKNTEMLVLAFALACRELKDRWTLSLVGSVTDEFKDWLFEFESKNPQLSGFISLEGRIDNKDALYSQYKKAKVFALTSVLEGGSPNVYAEAAYFGCTVVTTDIDAASDMTDGGRIGEIVPQGNTAEYAKALVRLCNDEERLYQESVLIRQYIKDFFDYDKIAERLKLLVQLYGNGEMTEEDSFGN